MRREENDKKNELKKPLPDCDAKLVTPLSHGYDARVTLLQHHIVLNII